LLKAKTDKVVLAQKEHSDIKWFSLKELENPQYNIKPEIKFYAEKAVEKSENST
jgi:hypothetical protein